MSEEEKTLDLNKEDDTSSGNGQPDKKTESEEKEFEKEPEDKTLNEALNDSDETVYVSKALLRQLKGDRDNYREGMLASKRKLASLSEEKEKREVEEKSTLNKIEKEGIEEACKDAEINENWAEVIKHYSPRRGKTSTKNIVDDLKDAKVLWKQYSEKPEGKGEDEEAKAKLSSSKTKPKTSKEGGKEKAKGRVIIQKQKPMKDWYSE